MNGKSAVEFKRSTAPGAVFSPQPITGNKTLADQVTDALINKIVGNEFAGSQLPSEQAMAEGFGVSVGEYADLSFSAKNMPVFSYGCAVFLQSDIVNFQRQGWRAEEILAGLASV